MKKAEYSKIDKTYKWGIFKKGGWKVIFLCSTKESAQKKIKGKEKILEVREIEWL